MSMEIIAMWLVLGLWPYQAPVSNPPEPVFGWAPVSHLCGVLETGRTWNEQEGQYSGPLSKTAINLYQAKWRTLCCEKLSLVATRVTSIDGEFNFGSVKSGRYWLSIQWHGQRMAVPVDVDVRHPWKDCDMQGLFVTDKTFVWGGREPGTAD